MRNDEHYSRDDGEPEARFASDAEIEIAERLRRDIEERYLRDEPRLAPALATPRRKA